MPKDIELIRDAIQNRALTVGEIAAEVGLNGRTVYRRIALLTADQRIHVEAWTEAYASGPRAKRYRWGKGRDAVMTPTPRMVDGERPSVAAPRPKREKLAARRRVHPAAVGRPLEDISREGAAGGVLSQ